jgi:hypothetical protein
MKKLSALLLLFVVSTANAATTRNDDSCDVGVYPAATLLLPYFEVDEAVSGRTTLFTVVNTTNIPQIARITLWTDWAYPVVDFPIYLTGYDVQAINMRDVLAGNAFAPTSNRTTPGSRSTASNPRFLADAASTCSTLPTSLPPTVLAEVRSAFTLGTLSGCGITRIGEGHARMVGYATIDVVATCRLGVAPTSTEALDTLLFDNVLTGDWQIIDANPASGNYAGGSPLVHLRAIPEGGAAGGDTVETNLPYTFYDRFEPTTRRRFDRRQPLPSAFAVRFIQGGSSGFLTNLLIWREGVTSGTALCSEYVSNSRLPMVEAVRFDERENPTANAPCTTTTCGLPTLQATSSVASSAIVFPPLVSGDVSGWLALNLNNGGSLNYSAAAGRNFAGSSTQLGVRQSQNWVVPMLFAEGRYSVARDATALANGCTPAPGTPSSPTSPIGPGPNVTP